MPVCCLLLLTILCPVHYSCGSFVCVCVCVCVCFRCWGTILFEFRVKWPLSIEVDIWVVVYFDPV